MPGKDVHLRIVHFNDVYNVEERKGKEPVGGAARFITAVKEARKGHPLSMVFFSGDAFNPSPISTITKGKHMVPALNAADITAAVVGNHDFDFGEDDLKRLASRCNFPWILSNLRDDKGKPLANAKEFFIVEREDLRVGVFGVIEEEWIDTLPDPPDNMVYQDFIECARDMSKRLREQERCDLVICLTHMRNPNDIKLTHAVETIDIVLGGHDHDYNKLELGTRLFVKSGTDFRTLSTVDVTIDKPSKSALGKVKSITCKRVDVTSDFQPDPEMAEFVDHELASKMKDKMGEIVAVTETPLDARTGTVRTQESNLGNLTAGLMRARYGADVALICGGMLRSDSVYGPGPITVADVLKIFAFQDPTVVLEVTGKTLREALENGLSQYPKHEGRFPQVSGMRFSFDPAMPPGSRIVQITTGPDEIPLEDEKIYKLATRYYLANGGDGYNCLKDCKRLVTEELGSLPSTIIMSAFKTAKVVKQWKARHKFMRASIAAWRGCRPAQQQCSPHVAAGKSRKRKDGSAAAEDAALATARSSAKMPHLAEALDLDPDEHEGVVIRPFTDGRIHIVGVTPAMTRASAAKSGQPRGSSGRRNTALFVGVEDVSSLFHDESQADVFHGEDSGTDAPASKRAKLEDKK